MELESEGTAMVQESADNAFREVIMDKVNRSVDMIVALWKMQGRIATEEERRGLVEMALDELGMPQEWGGFQEWLYGESNTCERCTIGCWLSGRLDDYAPQPGDCHLQLRHLAWIRAMLCGTFDCDHCKHWQLTIQGKRCYERVQWGAWHGDRVCDSWEERE